MLSFNQTESILYEKDVYVQEWTHFLISPLNFLITINFAFAEICVFDNVELSFQTKIKFENEKMS